MPSLRNTGHKIGAGTLNQAGVDALTAIVSFTAQTDQGLLIPWTAPQYELSTFPDNLRERYLDGSQRAHGYLRWQWGFPFWTFDMLQYWRTNIMSDAESAAVSVLTYDREDTAQYVAATAYEPILTPIVGGWQAIVEFDYGALITS